MEKQRCKWCTSDELYQNYHDKEWGVPLYDSDKLFEFIVLEGVQAGLSWITVLRKRENYRQAFDNFDAKKIARYTPKRIEKLLQNPGIIRNRLKVESAVKNAKAYLAMQDEGIDLSEFLWEIAGGEPVINHWKKDERIPAQTPTSERMAKALKKKGFSFVGPTTIYAFMQASGMVNDHLVTCFRHKECQRS